MKKFTIPCDFGGQKSPFDVYIGNPKDGNHPLQNQAAWLSSERGGTIPPDVMESFAKLLDLADKNGVSFEDLCVYAMESANAKKPDAAPVENPAGTPPAVSGATPPPAASAQYEATNPQTEVKLNPVPLKMADE